MIIVYLMYGILCRLLAMMIINALYNMNRFTLGGKPIEPWKWEVAELALAVYLTFLVVRALP